MNLNLLYQWQEVVSKGLPCLNRWQATNAALFSFGVACAESCQQRKIARRLAVLGQVASLERRLQRFLSNDKLPLEVVFSEWTRLVVARVETAGACRLLVDETKLGDRLGVMVVALAYEGRAIPLAWRCYAANSADSYPGEGQVAMIEALLRMVKRGLPVGWTVMVQADRGIGTSPELCRAVERLGWCYLFRVTKQTKIVTAQGAKTIYQQVQPGESWQASGRVFKQRGKVRGRACALWSQGQQEPWALVTNDPSATGWEYAQRNWQEQSFRDLKSQGWQWGRSQVRQVAHAQHLLLLLVLAYAWMLSLGAQAVLRQAATRLKRTASGTLGRRLSLFQDGLQVFLLLLHGPFPACPGFWFSLDSRLH